MERKQRLSFKFGGSSLLSCNATTVGTTSSLSKEPSAYPCRTNGSFPTRIRSASGYIDNHSVPFVRVSVECGGFHSAQNRIFNSSTQEEAKLNKKYRSASVRKIRCDTGGREKIGCNPVSPSSPSKTYIYYYKKKEKKMEKMGKVVRNKSKIKHRKSSDGRRLTGGSCFIEESFSVGHSGSELYRKKEKSNNTGKDGKRRSGYVFAVVKQSNDPYGDFRNSMAEMIMEKRLFGARELASLLVSYLSLNRTQLHPIIIEAFSELRKALHGS
ncbi:hypothetical protein HPP92_009036 [Vanilla planifolia]|uniref:Transcription repressor n=1 Tax=Vanilla planifolia TaxID=51239 RepID=A0A835V4B8_VANPL|nr:hypothetical protein HPP92_009034 [Vanilla planifolia]KAG0484957.1 hypothetical protein HPP92_009036 [Vanilla planifolia]